MVFRHWGLIFTRWMKRQRRKQYLKLANGNYPIIYITESLAEEIKSEIEKFSELVTPAIILIPGVKGNTGAGVKGVKDSVEKAIGSDIVFEK